jgi:hypothetical protein
VFFIKLSGDVETNPGPQDDAHRGVLLGIKTAVFKSVREIEHNHDLEIAMAEITTAKDMKLLICSCYRPPDADKTWIDKCLHTSFKNCNRWRFQFSARELELA